ncbi:hypothetical protein GCM10009742_77170 [Kribbella karoonensis]|uniref:HK97 family phage prohead protease n=2 Tax=Kribbellaceae TaxID=2726069 RepID=A0ABN2ER61_9ACTN
MSPSNTVPCPSPLRHYARPVIDIDLRNSPAIHTVTFDQAASGQQVIAAVRTVTERGGDQFFENEVYRDGWRHVVGRASEDPERSLVVAAHENTPYLDPHMRYSRVKLAYQPLPTAAPGNEHSAPDPNTPDVRDIVASMQQFGDELRQQVADLDPMEEMRSRDGSVHQIPRQVPDFAVQEMVEFAGPITGQDLISAVEMSCGKDTGTGYFESAPDSNARRVVGQTSIYTAKMVGVAPGSTMEDSGPSPDGLWIDPKKTYLSATVARVALPTTALVRDPDFNDHEMRVQTVKNFAEALRQNVRQLRAANVAGLNRGQGTRGVTAPVATTGEAGRRSGLSTTRPDRGLPRG